MNFRVLFLFALVVFIVTFTDAGILNLSTEKIIGGEYITIDQCPWHAVILGSPTEETDIKKYAYDTSGAIVTPKTIVAPAFALKFRQYKKVRAGSNSAILLGEIADVESIIFHELYVDSKLDYNLAIVVLTSPFILSDLINPIPLVNQDTKYPDGTLGTVTGYGTKAHIGNPVWWLQRTAIPLVNHELCSQLLNGTVITVYDRDLCAGLVNGQGPCQLDGGAPLVIGGELVGLFYNHLSCGVLGHPGVYVDMAQYTNWVKDKLEQLSL